MGLFAEAGYLRKALLASFAVHLFFVWAASNLPFFQQRITYTSPLFVDIVKIPPPPAKKAKKKSIVYKKPKKKKPKKKTTKKAKKKPRELARKAPDKETRPPEKTARPVVQGKISVDGTKFPFTYYLTIIQSKVTGEWEPRGGKTGEKEVVVYFRILKSGEITYARIEKSSGSRPLDLSALRAVTLASPLPPLPDEFEESFLGVHFGFTLELEG